MHMLHTIHLKLSRKKITEDVKISKIKSESSLHQSIACVLILAQCFGLMPVTGVSSDNVSQIKFKLFSFRTLYAMSTISGTVILLIMNVYRYINNGMHFGDIVTVIYFMGIFLTQILFMIIAMKWYDFMQNWYQVESIMHKYDYKPNLSKRFIITTCIVMCLALGEHILFICKISAFLFHCASFQSAPIRTYFGEAFSQIFSLTSFEYWKAIILEFLNILATFAWNFMDLFVMIMCAAMAEGFKQINEHVSYTKIHNEIFWKEIREDYNRLSALCRSLDETINNLISLCLINDLFFITVQLFNTLKPLSGVINSVYFICSFGFLLGRTAAVSIYAAWINDESKLILSSLFNVPSEFFGTEADRLIQQISYYPIAVTGSNFFEITRDFCLKVAGTIITFEIILQQIGPMLLNTNNDTGLPFCME